MPYLGARLYERVKDRLLIERWEIHTGIHPTMELDHISPEELTTLLIIAYASFYGRLGKILENIPRFYGMFPGLMKLVASELFLEKAKLVP